MATRALAILRLNDSLRRLPTKTVTSRVVAIDLLFWLVLGTIRLPPTAGHRAANDKDSRDTGRLRARARVSRRTAAMVAVAQLVESRIVIPVVVGSNPISHPILPVLPREHPLTL